MPRQSKAQKETVERVMHEYKHGDLESGSGRTVKSGKQAIAIALSEAGASNRQSRKENRAGLRKTKSNERTGDTARDRKEGRGDGPTKAVLYAEAKKRGISGRSSRTKAELADRLGA